MKEDIKSKEPFRFYTRLSLPELTGLRASTLQQLARLTKDMPDSCIYNHTHRFLKQHQRLSPKSPNDFSYWVGNTLGEKKLGGRLANIKIMEFSSVDSLRRKIAATISQYLRERPLSRLRYSGDSEAFYFIKSVSFIFPTNYIAHDLKEFAEALRGVAVDSLYFHVFDARLRLGQAANDFSNWIRNSIADEELANDISKLDPYTYTLEELRAMIIQLVERRLKE